MHIQLWKLKGQQWPIHFTRLYNHRLSLHNWKEYNYIKNIFSQKIKKSTQNFLFCNLLYVLQYFLELKLNVALKGFSFLLLYFVFLHFPVMLVLNPGTQNSLLWHISKDNRLLCTICGQCHLISGLQWDTPR